MQTSNLAHVKFSKKDSRWELWILGKLKAYANGETDQEQEEGKAELIKLAKSKGYTVICR